MESNNYMKGGSLLDIYMKEAGEIKLLTSNEEKELFKVMQKWSLNKKCSKLVERKGKEARERLITSNLRLVVKIAGQFRNIGLDYGDLINEGNIGLMNAIDKYDLDKGAKLSYYASFWIKQSIRRAISNKGRVIRLPVGIIEAKLKVYNFISDFEANNARSPSREEISEGTKLTVAKIRKIEKLNLQTESLNSLIKDESAEMGDSLINEKSLNPLLVCSNKNEVQILNDFLKKLDKRRRYIVTRRFGLDGLKPDTLEVIGGKFNLTRERIRQLEASALKSLKEMYKKINKNNFNE
ncbi:RNA polymerase subunit sigma [bacterium]|nr:RNA polymerase subunit sigma [bacterium]|tara:strand:- start:925 stop:1809 length:885 start_codon:yes stop_codon:yes gene_type:complete